MTRLWILGASDPEMAAIGTLLAQCGEEYAIATVDGQRVHPGCAYRMTRPLPDIWGDKKVVLVECGYDPALRIPSQRCARCGDYQWGDWAGYGDLGDDGQPVAGGMGYCGDLHEWSPTWTVVDHHRPGDPGYGRPSAEFMTASSIGQVLAILGREATQEQRLVAAADHCLAAAYRGECPGVDPDELMRWRIASRAAFQGRPEADVLADVQRAREALREGAARTVESVADFRGLPVAGGFLVADELDLRYEMLGENAVRLFVPQEILDEDHEWPADERYIVGNEIIVTNCHAIGRSADRFKYTCTCGEECRSGWRYRIAEVVPVSVQQCADMRGLNIPELPEAAAREGICFLASVRERDGREKVVCQAGTPEQIQAFIERWAPANGLTGIYGDPARGFAGGYTSR